MYIRFNTPSPRGNMFQNKTNSVTIIGAGLVGSLLASILAKRGYLVNLYEKRKDIRTSQSNEGKSINLALSDRGRLVLRLLGIEEEVLNHAVPMKGRLLHTPSGELKSVMYDIRSNKCIYSVKRNDLNIILLNTAEQHENLKIHFQHKLIHADFKSGVAVFQNPNFESVTIKADLIIGADGAFSTLRKLMQKEAIIDCEQTYIDHGYMEFKIAADKNKFMIPNHLHIWPRQSFMMIALPNKDSSWTVTLFMPIQKFEELDTVSKVKTLFFDQFSDIVPLMDVKSFVEHFLNFKPNSLVSIKSNCFHGDKALLIGDAAHAIVPFYGQGMNAGFEDCFILNELLNEFQEDFSIVVERFSQIRVKDAKAINDLAMYNYLEMRDFVNNWSFYWRKKIDNFLFWILNEKWVPLYNSVTFSAIPYKNCVENREWQDKILRGTTFAGILLMFLLLFSLLLNIQH